MRFQWADGPAINCNSCQRLIESVFECECLLQLIIACWPTWLASDEGDDDDDDDADGCGSRAASGEDPLQGLVIILRRTSASDQGRV